jgi:RNA polymerase sigma-70 factor (ECF subfamily)
MLPSAAIEVPHAPARASGAQSGAMDEPLIERAKQGDEAAFRQLFVDYRETVARIVHRVMGPSGDLEDVVQDVFIHIYRSLGNFRGDSKFSTWLYRLTVNVTRMHLRRGRSRPKFADVAVPEAPRDAAPPETPDVAAERAERVQALYRLLDGLSEKKRTVLVLHDFEGMAARDIADIVEVPVLTVRTRLFYARKELYAAIEQDPNLGPAVEALMSELPGRPGKQAEKQSTQGDSPEARESRP